MSNGLVPTESNDELAFEVEQLQKHLRNLLRQRVTTNPLEDLPWVVQTYQLLGYNQTTIGRILAGECFITESGQVVCSSREKAEES